MWSSTTEQGGCVQPFHLAIRVRDIREARRFYGDQMGFTEGRSADVWVDFNVYGHQVVTHLDPTLGPNGSLGAVYNPVDGDSVPVPHFGVVLTIEQWDELRERVESFVTEFVIPPHTRFSGEPGEQRTMFFTDPTGNALEFKAFRDVKGALFATT